MKTHKNRSGLSIEAAACTLLKRVADGGIRRDSAETTMDRVGGGGVGGERQVGQKTTENTDSEQSTCL